MQFLRLLILFYCCPKTGLHASKVKKHFSFLKNSALIWPRNDSYMTRAKQIEESVSLNPSFPWTLTAVIGQSFVIGLPHTARITAMSGHYPIYN